MIDEVDLGETKAGEPKLIITWRPDPERDLTFKVSENVPLASHAPDRQRMFVGTMRDYFRKKKDEFNRIVTFDSGESQANLLRGFRALVGLKYHIIASDNDGFARVRIRQPKRGS